MTLTEIATVLEANGADFSDRVFASLGSANPAKLFEESPAAESALEMLRRRRDLMVAIDIWPDSSSVTLS